MHLHRISGLTSRLESDRGPFRAVFGLQWGTAVGTLQRAHAQRNARRELFKQRGDAFRRRVRWPSILDWYLAAGHQFPPLNITAVLVDQNGLRRESRVIPLVFPERSPECGCRGLLPAEQFKQRPSIGVLCRCVLPGVGSWAFA